MVVVLIGVSGFVLWASLHTAQVTRHVVAANKLSADFNAAARAVAEEESLERKYRLEPSPETLSNYDTAAASLVEALNQVRADGDSADSSQANEVLVAHQPYLVAIKRMFAAVDRGDTVAVLAIDGQEVDPKFAAIEATIETAAQVHADRLSSSLQTLDRVERLTSGMVPIVFAVGLALIAAFASILHRVRRQLDRQVLQALHHSLHDALTGLPNRTLLAERFEQALDAGRRDNHSSALLLVDLDRFKEVNDTLGHDVGDKLLTLIGPRLATVVPEIATIARLGGDEFAVLLPHVDGLTMAIDVAAEVNHALSTPFEVEGIDLSVEASIGVVMSGIHGGDAASLIQHADVAMYVAKDQGIGVFAYRPDLDLHTPARLALLGELRRALESSDFELHYQPQVSLSSGEFFGAEALVRWRHPTRGLVMPNDFIPLAEHTAFIGPLTTRVLTIALTQVRQWLDAGHRIRVSVNISARNLADDRFVDEVIDLLDRHRVPTDLLGLEITESAIMAEPIAARQALMRLHEHGIHIAIDDFGAGYTSLSQLGSLPVTELKIDWSFVSTMDTDNGNGLIVRSVIDLGHNLGLRVIAEGVETEHVLSILADEGCDIAQGYLLARPLTPDKLLDYYISLCTPQGVGLSPR
ncbi:MAG: putative bifunctional diguanylate cyclase/phosphodiesterase [Ilumatobacteraceae bacterium]